MSEKFEVIIIGGGLAGIACAYTLAKAGLNVLVLERGNYSGAKNVMGGILFTTILAKLIPGFLKEAPLERFLIEHRYSLLSRDTELKFSFRTEKHNKPPHNHSFTVFRARFDQWFAAQAEESGVTILPDVVVDKLIWDNQRCIGVRSRLSEGDIYSDVVVLAEGANSLIAEKEGLKPASGTGSMAVAAKEIISLPSNVIEERFQLSTDNDGNRLPEGVAVEYFGDAVQGLFGSAFIYTNRNSLSVGIGCTLDSLARNKLNPHDVLEYFKNHPCVRNLLSGGKTEEYCAHLIPEGGYRHLPRLVFDGLLLIGDCAGLVNSSFFHEGSNLAMASGVSAAEAIIESAQREDFSREALSVYAQKLKNSFVIKDLEKFRNFPLLGEKCPEILSEYPEILAEMIVRYFEVSEEPKKNIERAVLGIFRRRLGILKFGKNMFNIVRALGWI